MINFGDLYVLTSSAMIWAKEEKTADERCCNLATHTVNNQRSLHGSVLDWLVGEKV